MKNKHSFISIVFIVIALSACSIQKRVYMPGNYVCWNKKTTLNQPKLNTKLAQKTEKKNSIALNSLYKWDTVSLNSAENLSASLNKNKVNTLPICKTSILAKQLLKPAIQSLKKTEPIPPTKKNKAEKNPFFSLFVLCLLLAILTSYTVVGLLLFGLLAFIFHKISKVKKEPKALAKHGFGVASFILGLSSPILCFVFFAAAYPLLYLGLYVFLATIGLTALIASILSIVLGIVAIKRNKINPKEQQGKGLAGAGIFFGSITLIFFLILATVLLLVLTILI